MITILLFKTIHTYHLTGFVGQVSQIHCFPVDLCSWSSLHQGLEAPLECKWKSSASKLTLLLAEFHSQQLVRLRALLLSGCLNCSLVFSPHVLLPQTTLFMCLCQETEVPNLSAVSLRSCPITMPNYIEESHKLCSTQEEGFDLYPFHMQNAFSPFPVLPKCQLHDTMAEIHVLLINTRQQSG